MLLVPYVLIFCRPCPPLQHRHVGSNDTWVETWSPTKAEDSMLVVTEKLLGNYTNNQILRQTNGVKQVVVATTESKFRRADTLPPC